MKELLDFVIGSIGTLVIFFVFAFMIDVSWSKVWKSINNWCYEKGLWSSPFTFSPSARKILNLIKSL